MHDLSPLVSLITKDKFNCAGAKRLWFTGGIFRTATMRLSSWMMLLRSLKWINSLMVATIKNASSASVRHTLEVTHVQSRLLIMSQQIQHKYFAEGLDRCVS